MNQGRIPQQDYKVKPSVWSAAANPFATSSWHAYRTIIPSSICPLQRRFRCQRRHLILRILDLSHLPIASTFAPCRARLRLALMAHASAQSSISLFLNRTFFNRSLWQRSHILLIAFTHIWARLSVTARSQMIAVSAEIVNTRLESHVTFQWSIREEIWWK